MKEQFDSAMGYDLYPGARLRGPNLGGRPDFGIGLSEVTDFEAELSEWSVSGAELKRLYKEAGQLREKVGHLKETV
ncbi:MAG TPA: hypothetical protein H9927_01610 [Candidatus Alistipes merdipullorum]|nr:hypothetical protein [Candidatus Alistipes merdipullorum]